LSGAIDDAAELAGDRPLRVLVTAPLARKPGGVAQYIRVLQPYLGKDVQYFTVGKRSDDERIGKTLVRMARDVTLFERTLRVGDYDLVHLNPSFSPKALIRDGILLTIAKAYHKAVIVTTHGWNERFERTCVAHLSWLFRLVYGRATAFVVLSKVFRDKLYALGYANHVFVQVPPIEDQLLAECRQEYRRRRLRAGKEFNILFLARVERAKGIYEALDTYRLLKRQHPFVSLTVAGDGSELTNAVRYADSQDLADVAFRGHVTGAAKYDVFLFPSHTEGLPISMLEAMAFGLPVVTCAVGGLRDWFQNGAMGFMTNTQDPEMLALFLSRLIREPILRSNISLFNREYVRDQCTGAEVAARIAGIYRFILDRAHQPFLHA
jgi:glycosyltransferase involved in cell wall biosynthesis